MFTSDELCLEKYIDAHVYMQPLAVERWEDYFYQILKNIFEDSKFATSYIDTQCLEYLQSAVFQHIMPVLFTPRDLKSYGRSLRSRLSTPASSVNLIDLICMVAIESKNPKLYQWIATEYRRLNISIKLDDFEYYESIQDFVDKNISASKCSDSVTPIVIEKLAKLKEDLVGLVCTYDEFCLLLFVFFREDVFGSERGFGGDLTYSRITNEFFFSNYFFREELPELALQPVWSRVTVLLKKMDFDGVLNLFMDDFKKSNNNFRTLIVKVIHHYIEALESPLDISLLIIFGRFLRRANLEESYEFGGIDEGNFLWRKLRLLKDRNLFYDTILTLLNAEGISDIFVASIVFYTLERQEEDRSIVLNDVERNNIKNIFCTRCANINEKNIFNKIVSDYPNGILYRWANICGRDSVENYLLPLLLENASALSSFIGMFYISDFRPYSTVRSEISIFLSDNGLKKILELIDFSLIQVSNSRDFLDLLHEELREE